MTRKTITFVLLLVANLVFADERLTDERRIIRAAMSAGRCDGVEGVSLRLGFTFEELKYTDHCWAMAQSKIVPSAKETGKCESVATLPGIYPLGADAEKRFVYQCWMDAGIRDLDSCIGMIEVGDTSSIPSIVKVLRRNAPIRMGKARRLAIIDTAGACMEAFARINGLSQRRVRAAARNWGGTWVDWAGQK